MKFPHRYYSFFGIFVAIFFIIPFNSHAAVITKNATTTISTNLANNALQNSLLLYYPLDNDGISGSTIYDRSGNGNNGTLSGGTSGVIGKFNQAVYLNGTSNSIVSAPFIFNTDQSFSIHLFVNVDSLSNSNQSIVAIQDSTDPGMGYHYTAIGIKDYHFTASFWNLPEIQGPDVSVGEWYSLDLTYNVGTHIESFFVNGQLQGTRTAEGIDGQFSPPGNGYLLIGQLESSCSFTVDGCGTYANYFNGSIDDIRVYTRPLTSSDAKILYTHKASMTINTSTNNKLTNGLVGLWSFDGKDYSSSIAHDMSGNGNDATPVNAPVVTAGEIGQAVNLNGDNQFLEVSSPNNIPVFNDNYTISAWIKPSILGQQAGIIGWGYYGNGNAVNAFRLVNTGECDNGQGLDNYWWGNDLYACTNLITANRWHHVVAEFDGTTRSIYVDGTLISSDTPTGHNVSSTAYFRIGQTDFTENFVGSLDDVRIYNRALSSSEITSLYKLGKR